MIDFVCDWWLIFNGFGFLIVVCCGLAVVWIPIFAFQFVISFWGKRYTLAFVLTALVMVGIWFFAWWVM